VAAKKKKVAKRKRGPVAAKKGHVVQDYGSKTRFVMGLPLDMSAREVVALGKAKGLVLSDAHVYKIRSVNKSKRDGVLRTAGTKKKTAKPVKNTAKAVRQIGKTAKKVAKPAKKAIRAKKRKTR